MRHVHGGNIYKNKCNMDYSANINPFGISENVKKAIYESIEGCVSYPDPECTVLREKLSLKENVDFDRIICSNGAAELIFAIVFAFMPKKAQILAPCFAEYEEALNSIKCEIGRYILSEANEFKVDYCFVDSIENDTDIVFITNPNNPTGKVCSLDFIKRLANRCKETDIILVIDECFVDFIENENKVSAINILDEYENIIILKAFTKFYSIPGLRLGYGLFNNREVANKVRGCIQTWNVSHPAQVAGVASLDEDNSYIVDYIKREREFLFDFLKEHSIKVYESSTNFILFREEKRFDKKMLDKGILIRSCSNYYGLDDTYYRIAVRSHEENMEFIRIYEEIIKERV